MKFINMFSTCFGKQKYSEFMDTAKVAAFGTGRYEKGYDPKKVPADDASRSSTFSSFSPRTTTTGSFWTTRSSSSPASPQAGRRLEVMSADEQKKVAEISAKMASEKNAKKLKELQEELQPL